MACITVLGYFFFTISTQLDLLRNSFKNYVIEQSQAAVEADLTPGEIVYAVYGTGEVADAWKSETKRGGKLLERVRYLLSLSSAVIVDHTSLLMDDPCPTGTNRLRLRMSDGKCLEIVEGSPLTFATALECEQFYANDNYFSGSTISAETGEDDLPWPFGDGPKRQLIDKMSANRLSLKMKGGIYELGDGDIITTHRAFSPTIAFRLTAKTNLYELRFAYIEKEMIFNWGSNANQFRIGEVPGTREEDKGPFDGKHVDGKGNIPIDTWVRIDVVVTETSFRVLVEGKERFFGEADMSGYKDSFRVYTWGLSKVSVRSLVEQRPD